MSHKRPVAAGTDRGISLEVRTFDAAGASEVGEIGGEGSSRPRWTLHATLGTQLCCASLTQRRFRPVRQQWAP